MIKVIRVVFTDNTQQDFVADDYWTNNGLLRMTNGEDRLDVAVSLAAVKYVINGEVAADEAEVKVFDDDEK